MVDNRFMRSTHRVYDADSQAQPAVTPPIDGSETELSVLVRNFILQAVLVGGALVAMLGLPETAFLARAVRFMKADEVKPLLGLISSMAASGIIAYRAWRRHRKLQVTTTLLPNAIARGPVNPSPSVVAAVEAARVVIDREDTASARQNGDVR